MKNKEEFKSFVRKNPILIKYVKNNTMTWQKFYEIFDLYGTDYEAWKEYLVDSPKQTEIKTDLVGFLKGIDMDKVQEGVQSLQRVVGVIGEMAGAKEVAAKPTYKPRPLYKHFDD
ncbi:MAG: spore coat protein YlbD [Bacilli bacterium]